MARTKRARRANGEKDAHGRAKRRRNGGGTLEKRGETWLARFYVFIDGERRRKTKTLLATTVEEARAELAALSEGGAVFTRERELEKTERELRGIRAEIEAAAERRAKEEAERMASEADARAITIADAWPHYLASKKRPDSGARTLAGYESQYRVFAEWTAKHYPVRMKMRDFSPSMAEQFLDHLEKTRSRNTRNKYLIFLRTFWRVLRWDADSQLKIDPWEGVRTVAASVDEVKHHDLTLDQIAAVAAVFDRDEVPGYKILNVFRFGDADIRDELRALFVVGLFTGARLGDCATIKWDGIDTLARTWTYEPRKTARKYRRSVTISIHPTLERVLASLPSFQDRRGYILPTLADIYINREASMLTNRVQAIFRAAGIETTADGENGTKTRTTVGFHSTRHFFCSWLNNHDVNVEVVNYLTCHDQGKVAAAYYHQNREAVRAAILTLPAVPAFAGDMNDTAPQAIENAVQDAPAVEGAIVPTDGADAREARWRAFCAALDGMTREQLEAAKAEIEKRLASFVA